jgi:hypothetical protein
VTDTSDHFLPEDYRFTADLLRRYTEPDSPVADSRALFRAVCSNNLNIILAALDKAGAEDDDRPVGVGGGIS